MSPISRGFIQSNMEYNTGIKKEWGLSVVLSTIGLSAAAAAESLQSCLTLCDPRDGSPPGFPVPGILQARTLEWVAISFFNAWKWSRSVVSDSSDPMDCSPLGSSIHVIFQARVLEWAASAFSDRTIYCEVNATVKYDMKNSKLETSV